MTSADVTRIAREVCTLWGLGSGSFWGKACDERSYEAKRAAEHFAGFLPDRILRAVRDCTYEDPKRAPNVAQILERARTSLKEAGAQARPSPDACSHPKPWAVLDAYSESYRDAICRVCLMEFSNVPANEVRTDSEVEALNRRRSEASHAL